MLPVADAPDSAVERLPRGSAWRNRLISAALGILVTVVGAVIIGRIQERRPALDYSTIESLPFSGPNGEVSIYQVTVSNNGKEEATDVACSVRVSTGKVDQFKITSSPLVNAVGTASGDTLSIQVASLNPSESFQVSILATGTQGLPARPEVAVRARGVLGNEKNPANNNPQPEPALIALAGAISAVGVTSGFMILLRRKSSASSLVGSGDDQRQIMAYICRAYGLKDLANEYSARAHETTYWAEADRLGEIAIQLRDNSQTQDIEKVLSALPEYNTKLPSASKAIVYYNIALINRFKGDEVNYGRYLRLAKETSRGIIERRLKIDPRFPKNQS